jgi:hypothetical protein
MKSLGFIFGLFVTSTALSQTDPSKVWHKGSLVFEKGDTLRGMIKYDLRQDLVLVDDEKNLFTPGKVVYFELFDKKARQLRLFYSLPYREGEDSKLGFFELLAEGRITALCKESFELRNYHIPITQKNTTRLTERRVLLHTFFVLKNTGHVERLYGKDDLIKLMGGDGELIEKYITTSNLDVQKKKDIAQIVNYYNSLYK